MRLYLDHRRTHLSRRYGHDNDPLAAFDKARRAIHEREPVYRFVYELRNFVQHCGMPLQEVRAHQRIVTSGATESVTAEVFVGFKKDELLRFYDGWRHGRPYLDLQSDEFEALPVFERTTELLLELEQATVSALLPELWDDAKRVVKLIDEGTNDAGIGMPAEVRSANESGTSTNISFKAPPFPILAWLKLITILNEAPGLRVNRAAFCLESPPFLV